MTQKPENKAVSKALEHISGNYTKAPNQLIEQTGLKDKDIRVWLYMAGRPPHWDFAAPRIGKAIGCKATAVESSLKRLISADWLARKKRPHSFRYDYTVLIPPKNE